MNFSDLGLKPELTAAVAEKGYTDPTPIQLAAIPAVLAGRDVLAGAQTGTGKTAGFVLPILQRLGARSPQGPRALILTPTRELAAQVEESVRHYGKNTTLQSHGRVRRCQRAAADLEAARWLRHPGGHAGPPARPRANRRPCHWRTCRCSCSTKPTACSTWASSTPSSACAPCCPKERQNLMFSATYSDDIRAPCTKLAAQSAEHRRVAAATAPPTRWSRFRIACPRITSATCWRT